MKTIVCPECGEIITVNPDETELFSRLVCISCYSTLEIIEEAPIAVSVVDIDPDEFDEDEYDADEDE